MTYPTSAVLAKVFQLGKLTDLLHGDYLQEIAQGRFSQGPPFAITHHNGAIMYGWPGFAVDGVEISGRGDVRLLGSEIGMKEAFRAFLKLPNRHSEKPIGRPRYLWISKQMLSAHRVSWSLVTCRGQKGAERYE